MADSDILRVAHAELIPWLLEGGLRGRPVTQTIDGYCERLVSLGVPLWRVTVGYLLIHPLYGGADYGWSAATGETTRSYYPRDAIKSDGFRNSPYFHALSDEIAFSRYRLGDGPCDPEFPIFERLRGDGVTDYCVLFESFGRRADVRFWDDRPPGFHMSEGVPSSHATGRLSGFSEPDIALIRAAAPALALAVKTTSAHALSAALLDTYLGPYSGKRVLEGQSTRGDVDRISSVVWLCDLRGSTTLADTLPLDAYLDLLNEYFECAAGAVIDHGSEVLKFIGDAVMAMFPIDDALRQPAEMARAALGAANEALARSRQRSKARAARDAPPIEIGVSLHVGELAYGNVGLPRRLDFTVIGPSANTVTRLQELCKTLNTPIIASAEFADICDCGLISLGEQPLRSVQDGIEVFTVPELADGGQGARSPDRANVVLPQ